MCHYNSADLEIYHWNSTNSIGTITIRYLFEICHALHQQRRQAHLQVYSNSYCPNCPWYKWIRCSQPIPTCHRVPHPHSPFNSDPIPNPRRGDWRRRRRRGRIHSSPVMESEADWRQGRRAAWMMKQWGTSTEPVCRWLVVGLEWICFAVGLEGICSNVVGLSVVWLDFSSSLLAGRVDLGFSLVRLLLGLTRFL